ncbi:tyrosine-type recombinase/integrase [Planctomycetota bacterium]|nr:tyrosine-type recombinase/integrase [Planctomycetota bacterium]
MATKSTGTKKKQRRRTEHTGVKILRLNRDGSKFHVARFIDPDTGKQSQVNLTRLGLSSKEARTQWAKQKAHTLNDRKAALESGTAVTSFTSPQEAVTAYFERVAGDLKPSSILVYQDATRPFLEWAKKHRLTCVEELTGPKLMLLRDYLVKRPKTVANKTIRGRRVAGKNPRSKATIYKIIRSMRTVLNHWRKRGFTPHLTSDTIRDHLEQVKVPKKLPRFLKPAEIKKLLKAALRHDKETYTHARIGSATHAEAFHYPPITPLIVTLLLTGMRRGEALELRWADVDLEAGEITLSDEATKTSHGRRIPLAESPTVIDLFNRMKLASDGDFVFGTEIDKPASVNVAKAARKRLTETFGAPEHWTFHDLRRTCGSFLTCAHSIYGAAAAFLSAARLGHSIEVAQRHYLGAISNIDPNAKTLEAAMGCEALFKQIAKKDVEIKVIRKASR